MAINESRYEAGSDISTVIRDLETRIIELEDYITWDKHLREQNPALQDLYEQYQMTKKLIQ